MTEFVTQSATFGEPGFWHTPAAPTGDGVVLTHGEGSNARSALLVAIAEALADQGAWVLRYDLPFRQQRPAGPPLGNGQQDRDGLALAASEMRKTAPKKVYLAGHSYGGRQASILAMEKPVVCDGLLLLSYPLHPPKSPSKLRTDHFPRLNVPCLFVHGTRDPFGSPAELQAAVSMIPAATTIVTIEHAGHDLRRGDFDIQAQVIQPFFELMNRKGHRQTTR